MPRCTLRAAASRETDRTKREALLHQIQRILHEDAMHAPIYELSPIAGVGPRVEQAGSA